MTKAYMIAEGQTISELERDVIYYIEMGYVPLGGVCARPPDEHGQSYLCQALIHPNLVKR